MLKAYERRRPLIESGRTGAYRLFHGAADGLDGLVIEQFGPVLFVQLHEERFAAPRESLRGNVERLCERTGAQSVYVKHFVRDRARLSDEQEAEHRSPDPWLGQPAPDEFTITEDGRRYCIRPYDGYSVGLFLEHRDHRRLVSELAAAAGAAFRVLNAFCYTCAFSIAAAVGGPGEVTSVDLSPRYLDWGRRNFAANAVPIDRHRFICDDVRQYYRRAQRQNRHYDLIILDPPTFARIKKPRGVFLLEADLAELLAGAARLLNPGGRLLFATNHRGLSATRIDDAIRHASTIRRFRREPLPDLPVDFAGDREYSRAVLLRMDD